MRGWYAHPLAARAPSADQRVLCAGGPGSSFYLDDHSHPKHLCGFGTDDADCSAYGPREVPTFSYESYNGVTNVTVPMPPPTPPPPPLPISPPPSTTWSGCMENASDVCYSFFTGTPGVDLEFSCSGTRAQIDKKFALGACSNDYAGYTSGGYENYCSDGGLGAYPVQRFFLAYEAPTFGCDYGSSCLSDSTGRVIASVCEQRRPFQEFIDCVDTDATNECVQRVTDLDLPDSTSDGSAYCRDGGLDAESATCAYGTHGCTRCGRRPNVYESLEQRRGLSGYAEGLQGNFARRRLQTAEQRGMAPSPPPPPPPLPAARGTFDEPTPPPSPIPPPPPPHCPPPLPPPSPSPPPNPRELF